MGAHQRDASLTRSGEKVGWRALYFVVAIVLSVAYFHSAIEVSSIKHLWMDEVIAVTAANQPTLAGVNSAIWAGTDFSPPLLHYLLHTLIYHANVFSAPLIYRVPSILSVYLAAWLVYVLVRRYVTAPVALAAFALMLCSGLFEFAVQARQYALLSLDLAAALVIWDGFQRTRYPTLSAIALWIAFALGLCTHFYGFLAIAAVGLCEVLYVVTGGGIRWRIWLALVLAFPVEIGLRPLAAHLASLNAGDNKALGYYAHPTIGAFTDALWRAWLGGSGGTLVVAAASLIAVLVSLARRSPWLSARLSAWDDEAPPASATNFLQLEIVLASLLLLPFVVFAFAMLVTGSFSYRYVMADALFFGIAGAYLLEKLKSRRTVSLLLMVLLICMLVGRGHASDELAGVMASLRQVPPDLPIVVEDGRDYIELMGAKDNPFRDRLYLLDYPPGYVSPDPTNEHAAARMAPFDPDYKVVGLHAFLADHKDFYLLTVPEHSSNGLLPWLFTDSITSRLLFSRIDATVLQVHDSDH
ncbi:hypothetical protein D0B32_20390 [Paraburkholderia sp. DHOC27]|nr:hypothetical protein D0B32_20390 [Paraburkholderia sp. DHOC27]